MGVAALPFNFFSEMTVHGELSVGFIIELAFIDLRQITFDDRVLKAGSPGFWDMNKQIFVREKHSTTLIRGNFYRPRLEIVAATLPKLKQYYSLKATV